MRLGDTRTGPVGRRVTFVLHIDVSMLVPPGGTTGWFDQVDLKPRSHLKRSGSGSMVVNPCSHHQQRVCALTFVNVQSGTSLTSFRAARTSNSPPCQGISYRFYSHITAEMQMQARATCLARDIAGDMSSVFPPFSRHHMSGYHP